MPPATHSVEREEERRLSTRTLTIASVASATAAAVTSQLWIAGTWLAAALTPVLVAVISEAMHRPTERIARAWTAERGEARSTRAVSPTSSEPVAVTGTPGPVRVYRTGDRGRGGSTLLTKRRIAFGTVAATAAIACVIGLLTLTTADLVSGGSVGKGSSRFTLAGSKDSKSKDEQNDATQGRQQQRQTPDQQQTAPSEQQPSTRQPAPEEQPPSDTAPVTPPAESAPGEPVPQTPTSP